MTPGSYLQQALFVTHISGIQSQLRQCQEGKVDPKELAACGIISNRVEDHVEEQIGQEVESEHMAKVVKTDMEENNVANPKQATDNDKVEEEANNNTEKYRRPSSFGDIEVNFATTWTLLAVCNTMWCCTRYHSSLSPCC